MNDPKEVAPGPGPRLAVIDALKGLAILFVLFIHAEPLKGWWIHEYVIDRAVPVFFVLFGVTSEYWWRSREGASFPAAILLWLRTRANRLLPPVAAASAVFVLAIWQWRADMSVTREMAGCFVGLCPWWGTSWFVTAILQLVVFFPLLRMLPIAVGNWPALFLAWAITVWSVSMPLEVMALMHDIFGGRGRPGLFYLNIFSPLYFWPVCAGIVIARTGLPSVSNPRAIAGAALFVVAASLVHANYEASWRNVAEMAQRTADPFLAVALLGATGALVKNPRIATVLVLAGSCSWGLYIGHTLAHEIVHLFGLWPEQGPRLTRWSYLFFLLVSGAGLVVVGNVARNFVSPEPAREAGSSA